MGVFAYYEGNRNVPEEKREIFIKHMLQILNYGGMLQFEKVSIYGKEILLIKPPEPDVNGKLEFHYNYFEDESWETAYFNTKTIYLASRKIGSDEFNWAISAAYSLYEVYDESAGTVMKDGTPINSAECLGWINYVLGTDFTIRNRYRLWEVFEAKGLSDYEEGYGVNIKMNDIIERVPSRFYKGLGGIELADICNILEGTSVLEEEDLSEGLYPQMILEIKMALRKYYGSEIHNTEKMEELFELLKKAKEERIAVPDMQLAELAELSLRVPARVFVYLSAEILEKNFWEMWANIVKEVYHDEDCSDYVTEEICKMRDEIRNTVMPDITTEDYFYNDGYFTFYDTPEELKGKPNYYITKDECAYWWDGEDEYFSESMQKWLEELSVRHKKIAKQIDTSIIKKEDFLKIMMEVLYEVNDYYRRIYAYRDMFYEFLLHADDENFYAAILLLKELANENKEDGKIIEILSGRWELKSKNVTFNIGRRRLKRYLAVMANKKIREKYFGF